MSDDALAVAIAVPRPDWRSVDSLAVDSVSSAHSKRAYAKALKDFLAWHSAEARPPFSRAIVQQYQSVLESAGLASLTAQANTVCVEGRLIFDRVDIPDVPAVVTAPVQ